ncbi:MAG: hypothetical protein ACKOC0_10640 [Cytophagales bacterium]
MIRAFYLFVFCMMASSQLCAQREKPLTLSKDFWGYKFQEGGQAISKQQAMRLLESNPEAIELFKQGNSNLVPAGILGFAGGFMIGWPIGQSLGGKNDPQWGLAVGGLALVLVGGVLEKSFQKKAKQAFDLYNKRALSSSLRLKATASGFAVTYSF